SSDGRDSNRDPCLLRLLVIRLRRRLLLADDAPHFVGDALVRRIERDREVAVLAQASVVEDTRRILAALLSAFDGVVVALWTDRQDAFVPGRRRGGPCLCLDRRGRRGLHD